MLIPLIMDPPISQPRIVKSCLIFFLEYLLVKVIYKHVTLYKTVNEIFSQYGMKAIILTRTREIKSNRRSHDRTNSWRFFHLEDLTSRMTQVLTQTQTHIQLSSHNSFVTHIDIKLDNTNYVLWSQVVKIYILGKDKLGYVNKDFPQPRPTNPNFRKWRIENAIMKG